jgi:hypothetical protein
VTPCGAIDAIGIPPRYRKTRAARGRFRKGRGQLFPLDLPLPASSLFTASRGQLSPANMAHAGREQHRVAALNLCNKTLPNIRSAPA